MENMSVNHLIRTNTSNRSFSGSEFVYDQTNWLLLHVSLMVETAFDLGLVRKSIFEV